MSLRGSPTYWVLALYLGICSSLFAGGDLPKTAIQDDGSFVVYQEAGAISEFVKQGTPRQSISLAGQNINVSYGYNSAGKVTLLISLPPSATSEAVFALDQNRVTIPPKSALRITLSASNQIEKMDGNPPGSVAFQKIAATPSTPPPAEKPMMESVPTQSSPVEIVPPPSSLPATPQTAPQASSSPADNPTFPTAAPSAPLEPSPSSSPTPLAETGPTFLDGWPGKLLEHPLTTTALEDEADLYRFYVRSESGARFVSAMNIVNIVGPVGGSNPLIQKKIAFNTGYRQDFDIGVWLTDWFGLAVETGFAVNGVRGNTQGMNVTSTTFWTIPILAQLCFQYPNSTGFIPYLNFGFGGGWTIMNVGSISYPQAGPGSTLSGTGNDMNNAYQLTLGVRYRLYEQLSLSLAYKYYGNSQATMDMSDNQQVTLGSPVTNSIELGGTFSF